MSQSRGSLQFQPLFNANEIGLSRSASLEHVVKVFLAVGEAIAVRWIEMPKGLLLLQAAPDQTASGAIYLYDRERQIFFFLGFAEGRDDTLTPAQFDALVCEYGLISWTANPGFIAADTRTTFA
jgi:hypothetical protein